MSKRQVSQKHIAREMQVASCERQGNQPTNRRLGINPNLFTRQLPEDEE